MLAKRVWRPATLDIISLVVCLLGFIGLTDIEVVRVEGVAMSAIGADKAVATATAHSREILARAA